MRRLFFGLCPNAQCRAQLARLAEAQLVPGSRAVPAENLHLTLLYLGRTSAEQFQAVVSAMDDFRSPGFGFCLDHTGHWRHPQVLWTAPSEIPIALEELAMRLRERVVELGFALDPRPFRAHLTLARKVRGRIVERAHPPIAWQADDCHLLESISVSGGVRYTELVRWPLPAPQ